jgi:hypothetical protein
MCRYVQKVNPLAITDCFCYESGQNGFVFPFSNDVYSSVNRISGNKKVKSNLSLTRPIYFAPEGESIRHYQCLCYRSLAQCVL